MRENTVEQILTIFVFLLLLMACGDAGPASSTPPADLFQHWIHSFEESSAEQKVYRPKDYSFPRARGREGFEIKKDGTFISYGIAPGDGSTAVEEKWLLQGHELAVIGQHQRRRYKLISVTSEKLVLERLAEN